jgi:hypothetical protein
MLQLMTWIGSEEHKELFCRSFIDSHTAYEPQELAWPRLDDSSLEFLRSIPVWTTALEVEVNAGALLRAFALTQRDGLVREALNLQGYEEDRHGRMISALVDRYALPAGTVVAKGRPSRREFLAFGYGECLDSFFGFGIFRIARDARVVSEELTNLFARVIFEEARHIVFFVNWVAYDCAQRGLRLPAMRVVPSLYGYFSAMLRTLRRATSVNRHDKGMTLAGDVFSGLTLPKFLRTALAENDRYMSAFDPRLLRPWLIPTLARAVLALPGVNGQRDQEKQYESEEASPPSSRT